MQETTMHSCVKEYPKGMCRDGTSLSLYFFAKKLARKNIKMYLCKILKNHA